MERITITVPDHVANKAKSAVSRGAAPSVSAYFATLGEKEPDWVMFEDGLQELNDMYGPIEAEAREWAHAVMTGDIPAALPSQ
jgi:hypothetical protein